MQGSRHVHLQGRRRVREKFQIFKMQDLVEARNVTHKAAQEQERYAAADYEEGAGSSSPIWSGPKCKDPG